MAKKPVSYLAGSVLIGTAIGAVVGMLTAPLSGKEMRGALRKRAEDAGRETSERLKDVPDALRDLPARGREALSRFPAFAKRRRDPDAPIETTAIRVEGREEDEE